MLVCVGFFVGEVNVGGLVKCRNFNLLSVLYGGCACCVCRWQGGVVRNSSAWFVLVNGEW